MELGDYANLCCGQHIQSYGPLATASPCAACETPRVGKLAANYTSRMYLNFFSSAQLAQRVKAAL
jgi:hypothetical protein